MTQQAIYRNRGMVRPESGAAVTALKSRAAAWEVPLVETQDQLSLFVWGGELRLTSRAGGLQIDLSAPESRLVGALRDSATDLFAEVGLTVQWEHVDAGALAPGLSLMQVASVTRPSPNFLRVRLSGDDAARFAAGGLHFRLLLPPTDQDPAWPRVAASGRTIWPDGPDALHRRVYTILEQHEDWIEFDIFRHANSPSCTWAEGNPVGQTVGVMGPGGGGCPDADRLWLFGDETALPAIVRMVKLARAQVTAVVSCDPADLLHHGPDMPVTHCPDLLAALDAHSRVDAGDFVWFAAREGQAVAARHLLKARGARKENFLVATYWS